MSLQLVLDWLFENYFGYYGRANGLVDAFDEQRTIHHQLIAERGRGYVHSHHAVVHRSAHGVAIDAITHHVSPHISGFLLVHLSLEVFLANVIVDDFAYLHCFGAFHCYDW